MTGIESVPNNPFQVRDDFPNFPLGLVGFNETTGHERRKTALDLLNALPDPFIVGTFHNAHPLNKDWAAL